ncbi:hypothetical protein RB2654_14025 [Rhodobacterales bacterium HTCC2654]|uniref:Uncharacterized protein n=1 Tax=Maritimibacter alkaliphilus HTCC2654 TaxID=314271 RepID=A3VGK4_9RHOB|nr:hypothetical protein RB2654_14025 [Rhodobacterales bacterium HTCC2654] [Maritimibacter alkaliphilus HTCC2654]
MRRSSERAARFCEIVWPDRPRSW